MHIPTELCGKGKSNLVEDCFDFLEEQIAINPANIYRGFFTFLSLLGLVSITACHNSCVQAVSAIQILFSVSLHAAFQNGADEFHRMGNP